MRTHLEPTVARFHELFDPFTERHGLSLRPDTSVNDHWERSFEISSDSTQLLFTWGTDYHGDVWLSLDVNVTWREERVPVDRWTCSFCRFLSLRTGEFEPLADLQTLDTLGDIESGLERLCERLDDVHRVLFADSQAELKMLWRRWVSQNCSHIRLQEDFTDKSQRYFQFLEHEHGFGIEDIQTNSYPDEMDETYAAEYRVGFLPCTVTYRKGRVVVEPRMVCNWVPIMVRIADADHNNRSFVITLPSLAERLNDGRWNAGEKDKIILSSDIDSLLSAYAANLKRLAPLFMTGRMPTTEEINAMMKKSCPDLRIGCFRFS